MNWLKRLVFYQGGVSVKVLRADRENVADTAPFQSVNAATDDLGLDARAYVVQASQAPATKVYQQVKHPGEE